jgi:hypothetical protein
MFEIQRIKLFGYEPAAKVTADALERIIIREFGDRADEVKQKLQHVVSETAGGKNRISAAILKLANGDINAIDHFIEVSNKDCRDVLAAAEYPGYSKIAFNDISKSKKGKIFASDWREYLGWLNG